MNASTVMWKLLKMGGCRGFFGRVESNIISVSPVCLLTSMADTRCVRVLIWQGVTMVLEE